MSKQLVARLQAANLFHAAHELGLAFSGKVIPEDIAAALDRFTAVPCPETAALLVREVPETLAIMLAADDALARALPPAARGPCLKDHDEALAAFTANLGVVDSIRCILQRLDQAEQLRVHLGVAGVQKALLDRLRQIELRKPLLMGCQRFLSRTVLDVPGAYRALFEVVGIRSQEITQSRF